MPSTYTPIATQTLGSAASSVTFSSISGSYTDLVLVAAFAATGGGYCQLVLNGDTTISNYSRTYIVGNGSAALSGRGSTPYFAGFSTGQMNFIMNFMSYSSTNTYKTMINREGDAAVQTAAQVTLWRNTAAVTSVAINAITSNFATGSTFTLYGIKAA